MVIKVIVDRNKHIMKVNINGHELFTWCNLQKVPGRIAWSLWDYGQTVFLIDNRRVDEDGEHYDEQCLVDWFREQEDPRRQISPYRVDWYHTPARWPHVWTFT